MGPSHICADLIGDVSVPKKGEAASHKQREALQMGAKSRAQKMKDTKNGTPGKGERWARLLSGDLTVQDLSDEEVSRMRTYSKGTTFVGRAPRLPSHLVQQFQDEQMRRIKSTIREYAPKAVKGLLELAQDPETPAAVRKDCWKLLLEHTIGKAPLTVQHNAGSGWDTLTNEAIGDVPVDRDL